MKTKKNSNPNNINKAFKYRLNPMPEQEKYFWDCFCATKIIWNKMLGDRMNTFKDTGKYASLNTPASYKGDYPFLKEVDSLALANTQLQLQRAYSDFFSEKNHKYTKKTIAKAERQKRKLTFYDYEKHPKYKSRHDTSWWTYTTNNQKNTIELFDKRIKLPKIGEVRCKIHRQIPDNSRICSATISKTPTGKYYVSVLVEFEHIVESVYPEYENTIGLDFSMPELYVTHENKTPQLPKPYRTAQTKLAREQRKLNKMQKDSNNYKKQKHKVALIHERIANQRKDFLHKQSNSITKNYDVICIEDLNMKGMSQSLNFGKSVGDNGWGYFTRFLEYKQKWLGHHFVKIAWNYPSSKMCRHCGYIYSGLTMSEREWTCERCGETLNRDENAAINIRNEGWRIVLESLSVVA